MRRHSESSGSPESPAPGPGRTEVHGEVYRRRWRNLSTYRLYAHAVVVLSHDVYIYLTSWWIILCGLGSWPNSMHAAWNSESYCTLKI